jgi:hypothetical protein
MGCTLEELDRAREHAERPRERDQYDQPDARFEYEIHDVADALSRGDVPSDAGGGGWTIGQI